MFRSTSCAAIAANSPTHWIDVQRAQFKRLGCIGEWDKPYTTMDFRAEAVIARELHKFVRQRAALSRLRPVMWSPVEKTALAEAEVEYHEKTSPTIYVKFPVLRGGAGPERRIHVVVIWTTTPWTIPGNRAIAYSPEIRTAFMKSRRSTKARSRVRAKICCSPKLWPNRWRTRQDCQL